MLGRPVFLLVQGDIVSAFCSERRAREFHAEHSSQPFTIFEVTGVRECTIGDFNRSLVAAKERELAEMRERLGVPAPPSGSVDR